jgi:hypothetical protein
MPMRVTAMKIHTPRNASRMKAVTIRSDLFLVRKEGFSTDSPQD